MKKTISIISMMIILATFTGCDWFQAEEPEVKEPTAAEEITTDEPTTPAEEPTDAEEPTTINFKEEIEKISASNDPVLIDNSAKKARDAQRLADITSVAMSIEEHRLMNDTLPATSCAAALAVEGRLQSDPNGNGPDSSLTGGFDCTDSYFYLNEVPGAAYAVYGQLETPIGNIDCDKIGTAELNESRDSYCYVIVMYL